jgi:hypothetical protein
MDDGAGGGYEKLSFLKKNLPLLFPCHPSINSLFDQKLRWVALTRLIYA